MNTLLIVGPGDIGRRALPTLLANYHVTALVRMHRTGARESTLGCREIRGELDDPASLAPLFGVATHVIHLAPPPEQGRIDTRTRNLIQALSGGAMVAQGLPSRFVYVSTTGVYGDCQGSLIDEGRPVNPATDRARRRVDAEEQLLAWGQRHGVAVSILRVPGIYASDRLPVERVRRGTPVLIDGDDVFTNHIHADDLANIVCATLERGGAGEIYNTIDDSELKMGAWFNLIADRARLARPRQISRQAAASGEIPPPLLSFMSESRRISNAKMKRSLGIVLRYPTVYDGVPAHIEPEH
ncbi:MAG: NAD-dependent epimerase/dehydratase family protein [Betaproteobacteria bacterium]|nr:NAD-dependent epimerase/dehydratase family protein [Betaproteobacteria bacterium]